MRPATSPLFGAAGYDGRRGWPDAAARLGQAATIGPTAGTTLPATGALFRPRKTCVAHGNLRPLAQDD